MSTSSPCRCSRSLPIFSSFLFLAAILPRSSFAQLSTALSSSATPTPTTLQISTSSSLRSASSSPSPTNTQPDKPAPSSSSTTTESQNQNGQVFNYYFLIVAVVAIFCCLAILYLGRRKKRKAAIMRSNSQRALARDVEGFRGRLGIRRPGFAPTSENVGEEPVEGLDERGEAPPPYMPRSKPPSLRETDEIPPPSIDAGVNGVAVTRAGEEVELRRMSRNAGGPPGYNENVSETAEGDMGIARPDGLLTIGDLESNLPRPYTALAFSDGYSGVSRPDTAITAAPSTRRLLNSSSGSGHEGA